MNTVSANLTDFDRQTVFSLRTCTCVCGPGLLALVEEVEVPFHQLNLIELAALNQAPLRCPCPTCGCETVAQYRASVMIPAESELPALAHVVIGDSEPQYALLARGELAGPAWTSVIASLHDPESWQPVDPDEEWLAEYWGRPLSTMALLRVRFAYCLDVEQEPCLLSTRGRTGTTCWRSGRSSRARTSRGRSRRPAGSASPTPASSSAMSGKPLPTPVSTVSLTTAAPTRNGCSASS